MVSLCVYALLHCCHGGRDGWHAKHREQELRGRMDMLFMDMEHLYSTYFVKAKDRPSNRRRVAAQHALEGGPVGIYKLYFVDNLLRQERILYELNMAYLLDEYADTFVDLMIILDYGKEDREQKVAVEAHWLSAAITGSKKQHGESKIKKQFTDRVLPRDNVDYL